jgi:hypothetical protein
VACSDNNVYALLMAGGFGLAAAVTAMVVNRSVRAPLQEGDLGARVSLAVTAAVLLLGWWLIRTVRVLLGESDRPRRWREAVHRASPGRRGIRRYGVDS